MMDPFFHNRRNARRVWGGVIAALLMAPICGGAVSGDDPDAFPLGETLTYHMKWGLIPVGVTQIATGWADLDGRRVMAVRFTARSNRLVETLYPVHDVLVSYIDPETRLPIRLVKKTSEGGLVCDDTLDFDRKKGMARWTNHAKNSVIEYPIGSNTHDVVSFMYSMRTLSVATGDVISVKIAADDKVRDFSIRSIRQEDVSLPELGVIPSELVQVSVDSKGFFVRKIPGDIWISREPPRIVTRLYVRVPVGRVKLTLTAIERSPDASP